MPHYGTISVSWENMEIQGRMRCGPFGDMSPVGVIQVKIMSSELPRRPFSGESPISLGVFVGEKVVEHHSGSLHKTFV